MLPECNSLEEVRLNIDRIDQEIVKLVAERSQFVKQAARFKKSVDDVKAPSRVEEVINKVRRLAAENNLDGDIIESIYRSMIDAFINYEIKEHNSK